MMSQPGPSVRNQEAAGEQSQLSSVWIFGYGSLLWNVGFPFQQKVVGYIEGYCRRFWQGSDDHRGVPESLGRVVTVIEDPKECTWGVAYLVNPLDVTEVMAYLNHREKGGYVTKEILFHPREDFHMEPFQALMYVGTEANPLFLGPASTEDIARQVVKSRGPSGCNTEYVLKLAQAFREISPSVSDDHLYSLEKQINDIVARCRVSGERSKDSLCTCEVCDLIDKSAV